MNAKIQAWLEAREATEMARTNEEKALKAAHGAKTPKNLRPATPKDVVEGAILWYPEHYDSEDEYSRAWELVAEVYRPRDEWKAYCTHDGSRMGLSGAFVEVTP